MCDMLHEQHHTITVIPDCRVGLQASAIPGEKVSEREGVTFEIESF